MEHTATIAASQNFSVLTLLITILQHLSTFIFNNSEYVLWELPYAFSFGKFVWASVENKDV